MPEIQPATVEYEKVQLVLLWYVFLSLCTFNIDYKGDVVERALSNFGRECRLLLGWLDIFGNSALHQQMGTGRIEHQLFCSQQWGSRLPKSFTNAWEVYCKFSGQARNQVAWTRFHWEAVLDLKSSMILAATLFPSSFQSMASFPADKQFQNGPTRVAEVAVQNEPF